MSMNKKRRIKYPDLPLPVDKPAWSRKHGRYKHRNLVRIIVVALLIGFGVYLTKWIRNGEVLMNEPIMPQDTMPYLFQVDDPWANEEYGDGLIRETGCGPTSLAMVLTPFLGWQPSPADIARFSQEYGYYVDGAGTSWDLFTDYPAQFGISVWQSEMDPVVIQNQVDQGNLLIFSMGPGDFTISGHIIAAGKSDEDGFLNVHDPNSKQRSKKWAMSELFRQANAVFVLQKE